MKKIIVSFLLSWCTMQIVVAQNLSVYDLQCANKENPLGVDDAQPRFSWKINSAVRNTKQVYYSLLVSDDLQTLEQEQGNVWNTGKVSSDASIQVSYNGQRLKSATTYYWKVKVWDNHNMVSDWSKTGSFQTGLFQQKDWNGAQWIGLQNLPDSLKMLPAPSEVNKGKKIPNDEVMPMFRKEFHATKEVSKAFMFIAGLGHFELRMNGQKVGDHFLDPGWTNYQKEAIYETFDVSSLVKNGDNAIGVLLGNGFYFTPLQRYKKLKVAYGYPKMICRLYIQYKDGSSENIVSNPSWNVAKSPIVFSSIYGGEDYDANLEQAGWDKAGFQQKWNNAIVVDGPKTLSSNVQLPIKVMQTFTPIKTIQNNEMSTVYDFGQNASGIVAIKVSGNKGDTIRVIPSELLNDRHEANQKATGSPYYFTYILKGDGEETWEPRFSYYGFRYAQVDLISPSHGVLPKVLSIEMKHTRNSAPQSGTFYSSDTLFNKTNTLINWAMKSNMVSLFTDCPHREKLGWLEQEHLMGNSLQYNFDIAAFVPKIVKDMRLAQTDSGLIPEVAPEFIHFGKPFRDSPEWGSSSILLTWYAYRWYGDLALLKENYTMMQNYIGYLQRQSDKGILMQGLSDWYDIGPAKSGFSQLTPQGLTATAIYHYDLLVMSKIAKLLGKQSDVTKYSSMALTVKKAFNEKFYHADTHQYGTGSQASNSMAVYMQLVAPENKQKVIDNIVAQLEKDNYRLTAGDIGFRYLLLVLAEAGRSDIVYKMNNRSDIPGYGYQLAKGATALTESWQAYPSVSNNHFMLGHIMEWFYQHIGGINLSDESVAYKHFIVKPEIVGNLTEAKTDYKSPYGTIENAWKKTGNVVTMDVVVPANTTATIIFPIGKIKTVKENDKTISRGKLYYRANTTQYNIGSGTYHFSVQYAE